MSDILLWILVVLAGFVALVAVFFVLFVACEIGLSAANRVARCFGHEI